MTPEARASGLGKALMHAVLQELSLDRSIQTVRLYVKAMQTAAVNLYVWCGFWIVEDDRATFGDGADYDGYLMEMTLR